MTDKDFNPYLLVGFGGSAFFIKHEDWRITADPMLGFDFGVGYEYYFGSKKRWSFGGKAYYHLTSYKGGIAEYYYTETDKTAEIDEYVYVDKDAEIDANGGFVVTAFTLSYTWRKKD